MREPAWWTRCVARLDEALEHLVDVEYGGGSLRCSDSEDEITEGPPDPAETTVRVHIVTRDPLTGAETGRQEVLLEKAAPARVKAEEVPDVAAAIAGAVRYHDQQYERLQAARRRWALIHAGAEQGDEEEARKTVEYLDRLYRASCLGIGEAFEAAIAGGVR